MAFVSKALIAHHNDGKGIGIANIFPQKRWRFMFYLRVLLQIGMGLMMMTSWFIWVWIPIRLSSRLLAKCGLGKGDFLSSIIIREIYLVCE